MAPWAMQPVVCIAGPQVARAVPAPQLQQLLQARRGFLLRLLVARAIVEL